ncbi:hypothetical protein GIB67_039779 [Kingdonia uniflora]|uniref:Uncharacterized protein n=1 Tax=Kingdonia uniflora TaxID=39325 RepID=A0A7J7MQL9_9MAGN|nr:hypothetical protein GIB67_039779 [Kingdonia uniflora]
MGCESSSSSPSSGKRNREPEDEAYLDNFHSHKRYLSEVMASSLNGLSVGDSVPENIMESPARVESICNLRDEISSQYSPMSEDFEDSRCNPESVPTSPCSPHRHQRTLGGLPSTPPTSYSLGCNLTSMTCSSQNRQRGSDSEGRLPSSPSDICHSSDLRRTALLRSVHMRTHPLSSPGREPMQNSETEEEEEEEEEEENIPNLFIEDDSSALMITESELNPENPCRALNMNEIEEESTKGVSRGKEMEITGLVSFERSDTDRHSIDCVDYK